MSAETIDLQPSPAEYGNIAAVLIREIVKDSTRPDAARSFLDSILDVARYLAVLDHTTGTTYIDTLKERIQ